MNVAYHSSDLFVEVVAVSMVSLFLNNKNMAEINVYIIENNISEKKKETLYSIAKNYSRNLYFIKMPNIQKQYNITICQIKKKWLWDSYCRLLLGSILPESVSRVLYLDGDTIVNGSLDELWNINLDGNYFAGVMDCFSQKYYDLFKLGSEARYCNSGMMLLDLDLWRSNLVEERVINYVKEHNGYVFFMEQTVMNIVCAGKILIVPPKYNAYSTFQRFSYKNINFLRKPVYWYTEDQAKEALDDPIIIHLTSSFYVINRPWVENCNHPYTMKFMEYRKYTSWNQKPFFEDKRTKSRRVLDSLVSLMPQTFIACIVGIIYNRFRPNVIRRKQGLYI